MNVFWSALDVNCVFACNGSAYASTVMGLSLMPARALPSSHPLYTPMHLDFEYTLFSCAFGRHAGGRPRRGKPHVHHELSKSGMNLPFKRPTHGTVHSPRSVLPVVHSAPREPPGLPYGNRSPIPAFLLLVHVRSGPSRRTDQKTLPCRGGWHGCRVRSAPRQPHRFQFPCLYPGFRIPSSTPVGKRNWHRPIQFARIRAMPPSATARERRGVRDPDPLARRLQQARAGCHGPPGTGDDGPGCLVGILSSVRRAEGEETHEARQEITASRVSRRFIVGRTPAPWLLPSKTFRVRQDDGH